MLFVAPNLIFVFTIFLVDTLSSFFPAKVPDPVTIEMRTSEELPGMCDTIPFMEGADVYAGRSETTEDCDYNSLGLPKGRYWLDIPGVEREPFKKHESKHSGETVDNGQIQDLESLPYIRIY